MKHRILALFLALCLCLPLAACGKKQGYDPLEGVQTRVVTDSAGRQVEIPADIRRVAPSGSTAQMILMPIAYDLLAGLASSPSTAQMPYFPEEVRYLPTFGQFYGSKANLNMESLIDARPQIIIDLGDKKDSIADDMDRIQKQTGIPTVFIEANLDDMAAAYRTLGDILNRSDMAESLARFIEKPSPWPGRIPQKSPRISGSPCCSAPGPRALPATPPGRSRRTSSTWWGPSTPLSPRRSATGAAAPPSVWRRYTPWSRT